MSIQQNSLKLKNEDKTPLEESLEVGSQLLQKPPSLGTLSFIPIQQ